MEIVEAFPRRPEPVKNLLDILRFFFFEKANLNWTMLIWACLLYFIGMKSLGVIPFPFTHDVYLNLEPKKRLDPTQLEETHLHFWEWVFYPLKELVSFPWITYNWTKILSSYKYHYHCNHSLFSYLVGVISYIINKKKHNFYWSTCFYIYIYMYIWWEMILLKSGKNHSHYFALRV